jgi:acyl-coenzyme A thioesterase PaaI-like protein
VLRVGRRIAFAEAHAYDLQGQLIGHATSTLASVGG